MNQIVRNYRGVPPIRSSILAYFSEVDTFTAVEAAAKLGVSRTAVTRSLRTLMAYKQAAFVKAEVINGKTVYYYTIKHRDDPNVVSRPKREIAPGNAMDRFWFKKPNIDTPCNDHTVEVTIPVADINDPIRQAFEKVAKDPMLKFGRTKRGYHDNPLVSRDWKWFLLGAKHGEKETQEVNAMWNALLNFCLDKADDPHEARTVMRLWREGSFGVIRKEWPEAPEEMFPK